MALSIVGCTSPPSDSRDDSAQPGGTALAPADGGQRPGDIAACPMEGDWTPCAVEERLVRAGVVIEKQDSAVHHPFFQVPGVSYHIGSAEHEVEVFLFPSVEAREHDTDALDSATVSPQGTHVAWRTPPTLVVSGNLAAVILSANERTVERLALALSAGLPQPAKR